MKSWGKWCSGTFFYNSQFIQDPDFDQNLRIHLHRDLPVFDFA